jgi:hypothetical protein
MRSRTVALGAFGAVLVMIQGYSAVAAGGRDGETVARPQGGGVTASTAPVQRSLREVLEPLGPTDEQRVRVIRIMEQAGEAWRAWWSVHGKATLEMSEEARHAVEAGDREKLNQVKAKWQAELKGMPRGGEAWEEIKKAYGAEDQERLEGLAKEARAAISLALHRSVREAVGRTTTATSQRCVGCHMPRLAP